MTLSLGERDDEELAAWRAAGADRYLLRFETSNRAAVRAHPSAAARAARPIAWRCSARCGELGYEVGSGVMIGIPGQTYDDLADDIELFGRAGPRHDRRRAVPASIPTRRWADRDAWPDAPDGRAGARPAS